MADRCLAETRAGRRCSALAVDGRHCPWHSAAPEWVAKRREWSARGGEGRSNANRARRQLPHELMTVVEVQAAICRAIRRVEAGELEAGPAQALSSLAKTFAMLAQVADFEARLSELERAAGIGRRVG